MYFLGDYKISSIFRVVGVPDILVVKILTGFEVFVHYVKDITHGVSVVILDGDA